MGYGGKGDVVLIGSWGGGGASSFGPCHCASGRAALEGKEVMHTCPPFEDKIHWWMCGWVVHPLGWGLRGRVPKHATEVGGPLG